MLISGHKTRSVFERYNIVDERNLHDAADRLYRHVTRACYDVESTLLTGRDSSVGRAAHL
jgi:hypothetical protein